MTDRPTGTITFLFTDIEGSTKLWERHPDAMKAALARHDALLKQAIEARGGYVFKTIGDAFCAAFAEPTDALEGVLAAQRSLQSEKWPAEIGAIRIRAALHTGVAEERDGDYFGPPLNRVARLLAAGHGGQTLLSLATQELVRDSLPQKTSLLDLGDHRLKDLFRPEHVFQLNAPDLPAEFPPLRTLDAKLTNLPAQPTPLIGREREVAAILSLMRRDDVRLVTLTGPGGTGKTRLGLQAAADLLDEYEHGVYWVDLAPITDPDLVLPTIAGALGVKESGDQPLIDSVKRFLRERQLLLVIDNFEQVIKASPVVGELLKATPKVKIIASSREKLRVYGEHEYPVPPLGLPDPRKQQTVAVVSQYEAVALFIQRAKASHPAFEITDQNAPAVAEICVRLDGLPLAIELAAARSRLLKPEAMLERLKDRLKTLTGGARDLPKRQQTIRGMIDWSYDLLDDAEKMLFARLGIFQGGRSIEAVEAVCGPGLDLDVTDGLESLLNKSLLREVEGLAGEPRFVMLETIHEYAREKLRDSGEAEAIQHRHAEYFVARVEQFKRDIRAGGQQYERFAWLDVEYANMRAALEWSLEGAEAETGLRIVGAVWPYWWRQGHHVEWRGWISRAEKTSAEMPPLLRAGVLRAKGNMLYAFNSCAESRRTLIEAVAIYRPFGDPYIIGMTLVELAAASFGIADEYVEAVASCQEGLALLRQSDDKGGIAQGLNVLGELARNHGDNDLAQSAYEECLTVAKEIGDKLRELIQYANLGLVALNRGEYDQARQLQKQAITLAVEVSNRVMILHVLPFAACALSGRGQPRRAARLIGASEALHSSMEIEIEASDLLEYERQVGMLREQLGEEEFNALRVEGSVMSLDEAVEYALQEVEDDA